VDDPVGVRTLTQGTAPPIPASLEATLVLLRHGESVFITEGRFQGQSDSPLSPLGERQAALAGARLAAPGRPPVLPVPGGRPVEVVHSPLTRTTQTATAVAAAIGPSGGPRVPLRPDAGFLEIGQGDWEGLHRAEIEERWPALLAAWRREPLSANAPGGERVVEVAARVYRAIAVALARLDGPARRDAAAGQAVPDRAAGHGRAHVAGYPGPPDSNVPWSVVVGHDGVFKIVLLALLDLPLERFWAFPFALCGLTIVEIRDGRAHLRGHNLTAHLAPLAGEPDAEAEADEREASGAL
jgi:broad specificity phosphatase PhoE